MATSQAELPAFFKGRLSVIGQVVRPTGEVLPVATDGRVYELTRGLVQAWVPFDPSREWETDPEMNEEDEALVDWDREAVPPAWMIRRVHYHLKRYVKTKEAMAFVGRRKAAGGNAPYDWLFIVPEQRCSGGGVESDDEEAPAMFKKMGYKMTGTLHTHPGESVAFSGIDFEWYKKVNGVHLIVSQKGGRAAVHVSVDVYVCTVEDLILPEDPWERMPREGKFKMVTSKNRKMKDLFKEWASSWPTTKPAETRPVSPWSLPSPATSTPVVAPGRMWFPDYERSSYDSRYLEEDQRWWDEFREMNKRHGRRKNRKDKGEGDRLIRMRTALDEWMRDHPASWLWAGEVKVLKGLTRRWITSQGLPHVAKALPLWRDMVDELWSERVLNMLNQVLRAEVR